MSYARDTKSIKANEAAYADYRDTVGDYAVTRFEADPVAVKELKQRTVGEDGRRIGGFDQVGYVMGQGADEINYRINKSGTFTMADLKDMDTFGGRADDGGVLVRKNASDLKVSGGVGGGAWRDVDDMIHNSDGGWSADNFDADVVAHTAKMRAADDKRQAAEKAARLARNPNNPDGKKANNDTTSPSAITQGPDNSAEQAARQAAEFKKAQEAMIREKYGHIFQLKGEEKKESFKPNSFQPESFFSQKESNLIGNPNSWASKKQAYQSQPSSIQDSMEAKERSKSFKERRKSGFARFASDNNSDNLEF